MIGRNTQIGKEIHRLEKKYTDWKRKKNRGAVGLFSRKSRKLFGPKKTVVKLQSACFEKLIFLLVLNIRKTKRAANFEGLGPRRCKDNKAIIILVPEKFWDF